MSNLKLIFVAVVSIAACGGGGNPKGVNKGMVSDATDFPVDVSNLEKVAVFGWAGGTAKSITVTRSALHQTKEGREGNEVVWGAVLKAGFASPVTLNVLPPGASAMTANMGGMIGGQTFTVVVELTNGKRGSQKFTLPMSVGLGGMCTADSKPAAHHGHCVLPVPGVNGNLCTHYTGTAGANIKDTKRTCEGILKGTYGEGECPATTRGQCLSRCGAPNESIDTVYFGPAEDWVKACAARKGTYSP